MLGLAVALLLASAPSVAAPAEGGARELPVAAGGGLEALTVSAPPGARVLRFEAGKARGEMAIDLGEGDRPDPGAVTLEVVPIGEGKRVAHVRVASATRPDVAWEVLLAGREAAVLWSGVTGLATGETGERAGEALDLSPPDEDEARTVIVGEVREDLRICGQARTLLSPRVLDPATLTFRNATMQRLPAEQREKAERVAAAPHHGAADPPLARLLVATGASTAVGAPAALTDGDPATTWAEGRPSDGHGEFVVIRAPADVPIARLTITVFPPAPGGDPKRAAAAPGAAHLEAPRSFFLVAGERTIAVTLPEDAWRHPGEAYDVPLVDPVRASCLTLVLDKAYERPGEAHPEVTLAEVTAYSAFDAPGATLDQVAKALAGGGARGDAAKGVLERAGDRGLAAAAAAFPGLDEAGRALAVDAAIGAGTCETTASLLLVAMGDKDREVARKGREKLERCGKRGAPALLAGIAGADDAQRANAAALAATVAPREALSPLAEAVVRGGPETRRALRAALARAARGASEAKLGEVLGAARGPEARLEILRALTAELPRIRAEADRAVASLAAGSAAMRTRYLLVEPLGALARAGDGDAASQLASLIGKDPDAAVRARAAEGAVGVDPAKDALARAAASDGSPRVREAALRSLGVLRPPAAVSAVADRLANDEWTFVRLAAASALASFPAGGAGDEALEKALGDASPGVREASVGALAAHRSGHAASKIRARAEDEHEELEVRLAAIKALAALCDAGSLDALTALAQRAPLPMASDEEIQLGLAAADALGHLHPADLASRLAPLAHADARSMPHLAAERAMATPGACK